MGGEKPPSKVELMKCSLCTELSVGMFPVLSSADYLTDCRNKDGKDHVVQELCLKHALKFGYGPSARKKDSLKNRQDRFRDFMQQGMDKPITPKEAYEFDKAVADSESLEAFKHLGRAAKDTGQAVATVAQQMADLLELTPEELREATAYEDRIEARLDRCIGDDMVEVILFPPNTREGIRDYLIDRYGGWDIQFTDDDTVWEFHAR